MHTRDMDEGKLKTIVCAHPIEQTRFKDNVQLSNCPPTKHQSEDEEEVAGHIDLAERIQVT